MHIRRYEDKDLDVVKALHRLAMEEIGAYLPGTWDEDLDHIRRVYLSAGGEFLVGEVNGEIVAMGALGPLDESRAELKRLRVSPAHQRQGFGQQILDRLERRAVECGYKYIDLDTLESQVGAIRFFSKNGYIQVGTRCFEGHTQLAFEKRLTSGTQ